MWKQISIWAIVLSAIFIALVIAGDLGLSPTKDQLQIVSIDTSRHPIWEVTYQDSTLTPVTIKMLAPADNIEASVKATIRNHYNPPIKEQYVPSVDMVGEIFNIEPEAPQGNLTS